ncbi:copper-binding protein [Variovorax sp. J22P168]|uniref:copper-binding protein n=1 Tax=Variovorax jilinensis TaxID=3053513 RepID=UPI00257642D2|nr:copper-binding protein [Variovorax sp. J22P168]MDM0011757.1 copper-binding protein [Variovorax sp. J22P168]
MNTFPKMILAAAAALMLAGAAHAQAAAAMPLSEGEVRKVDKEAGRLTLAHGPLENLDMPGMTMVFRVADGAMLDAVRPGDKVRFHAEQIQGRLTVTRIEAAR